MMLVAIEDITERKAAEVMVDAQTQALQLLAEGGPLDDVLGFLIGVVERHSAAGMVAAITPLNEAGTHFQRGIGASLPEAFNAAVEGVAVSSPTGLCAVSVRRGAGVSVHDFDEDAAWQPFGKFVAPYGLRSGWSTPIRSSGGKMLGTFANYYRKTGDPTPKNRELVDMVARTAAIAIERKHSEEALMKAAERLRFMAESMPQKIFTAKLNGEVDYFNQQWMDFTGLSFEQIRDWGWTQFVHPDDLEENIRRWKHSIETGAHFQLDHRFRRKDGVYRWHLSRAHAMRDAEGKVVMWIGSNTDIDDVKRGEEALRDSHAGLEQIVEQRTAAVRELSSSLLRSQDDERRRISRELHDSLGQYLASATMSLGALKRPNATEKETKNFAHLKDILDRCLTETRTISYLLHPPLLDEVGFSAAARWCVEGFSERSGIAANFNIPVDLKRLPDALEIALFRILQESLTNIHRYSHSPSVDIQMELDVDHITLQVKDYGQGVPPELLERFRANGSGTGIGLRSMRERISELGGQFEIQSDRHGTLIKVTAPISDPVAKSLTPAPKPTRR